jgi:hypothetical protein
MKRTFFQWVFFKTNLSVRPLFRKFLFKKNGTLRYRFKTLLSTEQVAASLVQEKIQSLNYLFSSENARRDRHDNLGALKILNHSQLMQEIEKNLNSTKTVLVSISHDDYRKHTGGVQICIQHEEQAAKLKGSTYLHIRPARDSENRLYSHESGTVISIVNNGVDCGHSLISTLTSAVSSLDKVNFHVIIHHMMDLNVEHLSDLVEVSRAKSCIFWLHDYYSICPSYKLLRNDISFCNAPDTNSNACELCAYKDRRLLHFSRMKSFFARHNVKILSPSMHALRLWSTKSNLTATESFVVPHKKLQISYRNQKLKPSGRSLIRMAFLGHRVTPKGWPVFNRLIADFASKGEYELFVFSEEESAVGYASYVKVKVTAKNPTAMSDAVRQKEIDIVVLWPTWPETFSLTAFEALAGGAFIITNPLSGNISDIVRETGRGVVLDTEESLWEFLSGVSIKLLVEKRREQYFNEEITTKISMMSLEHLKLNENTRVH